MTHTPGAWSIDGLTIIDQDDNIICWMGEPAQYPGDTPTICDNDVANARLIAASPDMLEALRSLENDAGQMPEFMWKMVQDAVEKAGGKRKE